MKRLLKILMILIIILTAVLAGTILLENTAFKNQSTAGVPAPEPTAQPEGSAAPGLPSFAEQPEENESKKIASINNLEELLKPTPTPEPTQAPSNNSGISDGSNPAVNQIVSKYYGILSGLQGKYMGQAAGLMESAKAEYVAAVQSGADRETAKANIYGKYAGQLFALKGSCDGEVESALASMQAELVAIGADTSPVAQLRGTYNSIVSSYMGGF